MKYVAFLRAINTGKRRLKMAELREAFEGNGYPGAATHLATGNVILESDERPDSAGMEEFLDAALGWENRVFLRSVDEIAVLIDAVPWSEADGIVEVSFLEREPDPEAARALEATAVAPERLLVVGSDVLLLRTGTFLDTTHKESTTVKMLGSETTRRGMATIHGIRDRYL